MKLIITRDTGMYSKIRKINILLDGNCLVQRAYAKDSPLKSNRTALF